MTFCIIIINIIILETIYYLLASKINNLGNRQPSCIFSHLRKTRNRNKIENVLKYIHKTLKLDQEKAKIDKI